MQAFYLSVNDHLTVYRNLNSPNTSLDTLEVLGLEQLWSVFCSKNAKFPAKYKVYSFFRAQRFVVRSGMHFGVDFAVYRLLPTQCHSEICSLVVDSINCSYSDESDPNSFQQLSSRHLSTLTRVMPDVMKLLVVCYVLPSSTWSAASGTAQSGPVRLEEANVNEESPENSTSQILEAAVPEPSETNGSQNENSSKCSSEGALN